MIAWLIFLWTNLRRQPKEVYRWTEADRLVFEQGIQDGIAEYLAGPDPLFGSATNRIFAAQSAPIDGEKR